MIYKEKKKTIPDIYNTLLMTTELSYHDVEKKRMIKARIDVKTVVQRFWHIGVGDNAVTLYIKTRNIKTIVITFP